MTANTESPSPLLSTGAAARPNLAAAGILARLEMLWLSLLASACSAAGLGLAYRFPRLRGDQNESAGQAARKDR